MDIIIYPQQVEVCLNYIMKGPERGTPRIGPESFKFPNTQQSSLYTHNYTDWGNQPKLLPLCRGRTISHPLLLLHN